MLHLTNGDTAVDALRAAGMEGPVVPWRDVLHEGPVPAGLAPEDLRAVRAAFIAAQGWGDAAAVAADFARRDATLADAAAHDEVVLWFEHDLYDQLQLLQVIDHLTAAGVEAGVTLVTTDHYLGPAEPARLRALFSSRTPLAAAQRRLAAAAWQAFRAPEPTALAALTAGDTEALPFLGGALVRLLEEYPEARTGLSRSERQILEVVAAGPVTPAAAFRASHHDREARLFLGDTVFAAYLARLGRTPVPLLTFADGGTVRAPRGGEAASGFWSTPLRLTEEGRAVLGAEVDYVARAGLDRWLGGVHLYGRTVRWRWHAAERRVVEENG